MWYQIRLKSQTYTPRVFHIADETTYGAVGSGPGVWGGGGLGHSPAEWGQDDAPGVICPLAHE